MKFICSKCGYAGDGPDFPHPRSIDGRDCPYVARRVPEFATRPQTPASPQPEAAEPVAINSRIEAGIRSWLNELMGDHDFTLPSAAYEEILEHLQANLHAPPPSQRQEDDGTVDYASKLDTLVTALREIEWSNDTRWQSDRAREALWSAQYLPAKEDPLQRQEVAQVEAALADRTEGERTVSDDKMLNGLTEAEATATASVAGLSAGGVPELPVVAYRRCSTFTGWYYWGDDHAEPGSPNAEDLTPHASAQAIIHAQAAEIERIAAHNQMLQRDLDAACEGESKWQADYLRLSDEFAALIPPAGMAEDTARIDWLENELQEHGEANFSADAKPNARGVVSLFTVLSQHVKGDFIRAAIDAAMASPTPPQEAE